MAAPRRADGAPESRSGDRFRWLLVTSGGLGAAPVAPGTVGTLGGVLLAIPAVLLLDGPWLPLGVCLALAVALFWVGCTMTDYVQRAFPVKDPGAFVLDEVVGYLLTVGMMAPWWSSSPWFLLSLAFALFRVFDITKPGPVRRVERWPGALGIMADDAVAGVLAGLVGIAVGLLAFA